MANMREKALEIKRKQAEAVASQKQIQRDDAIMKVEGEQQAQAAAQGMAPGSGTLGALTAGSYNKYAESSQTGKFNLEMQELSIDQKQAEVESRANAEIFGVLIDTATKAAQMYVGKPPTGAGKSSFSKSDYNLPDYLYKDREKTETEEDYLESFRNHSPFSKHLVGTSGE